MTLPDRPGEVACFPLVQTCWEGIIHWTALPGSSGTEGDELAPALLLVDRPAEQTTTTASVGETSSPTARCSRVERCGEDACRPPRASSGHRRRRRAIARRDGSSRSPRHQARLGSSSRCLWRPGAMGGGTRSNTSSGLLERFGLAVPGESDPAIDSEAARAVRNAHMRKPHAACRASLTLLGKIRSGRSICRRSPPSTRSRCGRLD